MMNIPHLLSRGGAVTLLVLGALVWNGCASDAGADEAPAADPAVPVRVADITPVADVLPIRTSGRVAAKAEIALSFKVGGVISRVLVDEGQTVQRGQVLAQLELDEIDAQVTQARSAFEKAERDYARMQRLYADSVVTRVQVEDTGTGLEAAQAALDAAQFNRRYAVITAPARGRVLERMAENHELVGAGTPILRLGASDEGWVIRIGVADRDVVRLRPGDPADVAFDAYPGTPFTGRVTEIADAAQRGTSTFEVEVQLNDPAGRLKSGFIGQVQLYPSDGTSYQRVPIEAIVEANDDQGVVYLLDPATQRVRRTPIGIARILDDAVAIQGTLDGTVVTDGAAYLSDGALVAVQD
ncbi:MAG: efflux RND transporter periplasmic adaptor subunit [Bacteroidota bacterium]